MKKRRWGSGLYMALLLILMYLPIAVVVLFSFNANTARNTTVFTGFSLQWYRDLFLDTRGFGQALLSSLELALASCLLSGIIGTLGAVGMAEKELRGRVGLIGRMAQGLTTLPIMIPEIILGIALMALYYAVDLPLGMLALVISHTTFCIPYIFIVVKGRLAGMDPALTEAARDLGASPRRALKDITLPLILPGILSGCFLALAMSLDDFIISFFVTGPGTVTLPLKIYSSIKTGISPQVNALSTLILVVIVLCVGAAQLLGKNKKQIKRSD